jgi:hypothetical protein
MPLDSNECATVYDPVDAPSRNQPCDDRNDCEQRLQIFSARPLDKGAPHDDFAVVYRLRVLPHSAESGPVSTVFSAAVIDLISLASEV